MTQSGIEVVSFHEFSSTQEVNQAAYRQYGIISRNRPALSRFGVRTLEYYPTFKDYIKDITASVEGKPLPSQTEKDIFCDFNVVYLDRRIGRIAIGGIDVSFTMEKPRSRIIGYYGDVDSGYEGRGYYSVAVSQVVDRLALDPDIDTLEASVHVENMRSIALLGRIGFIQSEDVSLTDNHLFTLDITSK